MAVNGIGTYSASFYQSMYKSNGTKSLLSGIGKSNTSNSDPLSSVYNNLSNNALYKTAGYKSLVNSYYAKKADELSAESESASEKTEQTAEEKAEEVLNNLQYNASGAVSSGNSVSVGSLINIKV